MQVDLYSGREMVVGVKAETEVLNTDIKTSQTLQHVQPQSCVI